jgi:hypothetical protein
LRRALRDPLFVKACALALVLLLALWAFVSYLSPAFTGERIGELLLCN